MVVRSIRSIAMPQHHVPRGHCPATAALHHNALRGLARVTCELREGMAILHGKVSSFYLKQLAQEVVKKVDGVELVVNQVDVGQVDVGKST